MILVYNEEWIQIMPELERQIRETEIVAKSAGGARLVVHDVDTGLAIGHKARTNAILQSASIPTPLMVRSPDRSRAVFSNTVLGTGNDVIVYAPGDAFDETRYNTEYINTIHEYRGKTYYVILRAMCVGEILVSVYIGARSTSENNPSVHLIDTPLDPNLMNYLYSTVVLPRYEALSTICRRLGSVLGMGFYCHDILPEAGSDRLYVCETGYKFDLVDARERLLPIHEKLVFADMCTSAATIKASHAFFYSIRKMGLF
jgi:hypothetical protein